GTASRRARNKFRGIITHPSWSITLDLGRSGHANDLYQARSITKRNSPMKFADFISVKAIKPDLESKDKESVIRELAASLVASGDIMEDSVESIIKAILKREELGSTGIGRGIAVPHTKHPSVEKLVGTVGVSREGVD